jgi:hypothetical protein
MNKNQHLLTAKSNLICALYASKDANQSLLTHLLSLSLKEIEDVLSQRADSKITPVNQIQSKIKRKPAKKGKKFSSK